MQDAIQPRVLLLLLLLHVVHILECCIESVLLQAEFELVWDTRITQELIQCVSTLFVTCETTGALAHGT
jgi:hypothetical protein